ncbi:MAG: hypothetical protein ACOC1O_01605 [bacterium]
MNNQKKLVNHYASLIREKSINLSQASVRLAIDLGINEETAADMLNPFTESTKYIVNSASKFMNEQDEDDEEIEDAEEEVEDAEEEVEDAEEEIEDAEEEVEDDEDLEVDAEEVMDIDPEWAKHYAMAQEVAKWADNLSEHQDAKIVELAWKVETAIKNILPTIKEMEEII